MLDWLSVSLLFQNCSVGSELWSLSAFPQTSKPPADVRFWYGIGPDSAIDLYSPKIEVGQGNHTLLAQIAASELGIASPAFECTNQTATAEVLRWSTLPAEARRS
jgi:CO/xanthine dehydrogenase Mo-binding subunit